MSVVEIVERSDGGNFPIFFFLLFFFLCLAASVLCCSEFPRVLAGFEMSFKRDSCITISSMGFSFCFRDVL